MFLLTDFTIENHHYTTSFEHALNVMFQASNKANNLLPFGSEHDGSIKESPVVASDEPLEHVAPKKHASKDTPAESSSENTSCSTPSTKRAGSFDL